MTTKTVTLEALERYKDDIYAGGKFTSLVPWSQLSTTGVKAHIGKVFGTYMDSEYVVLGTLEEPVLTHDLLERVFFEVEDKDDDGVFQASMRGLYKVHTFFLWQRPSVPGHVFVNDKKDTHGALNTYCTPAGIREALVQYFNNLHAGITQKHEIMLSHLNAGGLV